MSSKTNSNVRYHIRTMTTNELCEFYNIAIDSQGRVWDDCLHTKMYYNDLNDWADAVEQDEQEAVTFEKIQHHKHYFDE